MSSGGRLGARRGGPRGGLATLDSNMHAASTTSNRTHSGRASNMNIARSASNAQRDGSRKHQGTTRNALLSGEAPSSTGSRQSSQKAQPGGRLPVANGDWADRYQTLKTAREKERADAIRQGLMSGEKAMKLEDAITPVGTCMSMCAEFERVERAVRNEVEDAEKTLNHSAYARSDAQPDESRMVKRFQRSAAGQETQLPSDLRPPPVLKMTCDYLFHELLGEPNSLYSKHHFVWDRTRAIRNDISIQQFSKPEDLRIAIECYERIARFHIVSLHQMALKEKPHPKYDAQQNREQLDRTLLSLMQCYDDCRGRFPLSNEAEFRAYGILLQLQDRIPDLEDRVQLWPLHIQKDSRVQIALELYRAAGNTSDWQGPFQSHATSHVIARQDWENFWQIVNSPSVSYLMACCAEIYFPLIRQMALKAIVRSSRPVKQSANLDWSMDSVWEFFNFDTEDDLVDFCAQYGLRFCPQPGSDDLALEITTRNLPDPEKRPSQLKSSLVENKRERRTLPAVIDGLTVRQAQETGQLVEGEDVEEEGGVGDVEQLPEGQNVTAAEQSDEEDSLFVPETREESGSTEQKLSNPSGVPTLKTGFTFANASGPTGFSFSKPAGQPAFGQPSTSFGAPSSPFAPTVEKREETPANQSQNVKDDTQDSISGNTSPFGFLSGATTAAPTKSVPGLGTFNPLAATRNGDSKDAQFVFSERTAVPSPINSNPFASKREVSNPTSTSAAAPASTPAPSGLFTSKPTTWTFGQTSSAPQQPETPALNQQPKSLFFPTGNPAIAPSPSVHPEPSSKPAPSPQPHLGATNVTPQTVTTTPDANVSAVNSGSISPTRRQSINAGQDTKPKRPSPLHNSFTAGDEGATSHAVQHPLKTSLKPSNRETFAGRQASSSLDLTASRPPSRSAEAELESILERLADEVTLSTSGGLLKQYVNFFLGKLVTEVQEKIYLERIEKEAQEYRRFCLEEKYGRKWREIFRRRRLKKQAAARRQRAQRRLQESQRSDSSGTSSILGSISAHSRTGATMGNSRSKPNTQTSVDAMFQSTNGVSRIALERQARAGSKRPAASSFDGESIASSRGTGHKRTKSSSHAASHESDPGIGAAHNPHASVLNRSSFLGFSLSSSAPDSTSTTKSTYFRMKAMGLKPRPSTDVSQSRGTKRPRSESLDAASAKLSASTNPSVAQDRDRALMPPPSVNSVRSKVEDDDQAIFARLRAARESLSASTNLMKSEVQKDEEFRRSAGKSQSDTGRQPIESGGFELHKSLDGSKLGSPSGDRDVPAYRLRESRFVPREHYGRAIERANELRASRSRDNSGPEAHANGVSEEAYVTAASGDVKPPAEVAGRSPHEHEVKNANGRNDSGLRGASTIAPSASAPKSHFGFGSSSSFGFGAQANSSGFQQPQQSQAPNPFSQSSSFAPPLNGANPFLQSSAPSFGDAGSFTHVAAMDATNGTYHVAPAQADDVLAVSGFGASVSANTPPWSFATAPGDLNEPAGYAVLPDQISTSLDYTFGQPAAPGSPITLEGSTQKIAHATLQAAPNALSSLHNNEAGHMNFMTQGQDEMFGPIDQYARAEDASNESANEDFNNQLSSRAATTQYAGRFAALADEDDESEEFQDHKLGHAGQEISDAEELDDEDSNHDPHHQQCDDLIDDEDSNHDPHHQQCDDLIDDDDDDDEEEEHGGVNGHARWFSDEEASDGNSNGDAESEGEFDEDEDEYDEDEREEDGLEPGLHAHGYLQRRTHQGPPKPQPDPALLAVGNNEDDAIELSD